MAAVGAPAHEVGEQRAAASRRRAPRAPRARRARRSPTPRRAARPSMRSSSPSWCTRRTDGPPAPSSPAARSRPSRATQRSAACSRRPQVGDPLAAAVGPLDARDEARHDRLHGVEDAAAVVARLGQRVGQQVQDELLVGLAGGEDPHVRQRGGGQQPAQEVQRLGLDRARVRLRRLAGGRRVLLGRPRLHLRQRGGVDAEDLVHRGLVVRARARRRGSSGTATCPRSARRRRCSAWTARGRRPGAGAAGPSSGRWRPTRRRRARRRAGRSSRRRSRRRSARRSRPRGRPRRCRTWPARRRRRSEAANSSRYSRRSVPG